MKLRHLNKKKIEWNGMEWNVNKSKIKKCQPNFFSGRNCYQILITPSNLKPC